MAKLQAKKRASKAMMKYVYEDTNNQLQAQDTVERVWKMFSTKTMTTEQLRHKALCQKTEYERSKQPWMKWGEIYKQLEQAKPSSIHRWMLFYIQTRGSNIEHLLRKLEQRGGSRHTTPLLMKTFWRKVEEHWPELKDVVQRKRQEQEEDQMY